MSKSMKYVDGNVLNSYTSHKTGFNSLPFFLADLIYEICRFYNRRSPKKYPSMKGRKGGYFCILDRKTGNIVATFLVGKAPTEKAVKYFEFAPEKAKRLFSHLHEGHLTSNESKDEQHEQYGGAIAGKEYIYSFSGFSPAVIDSYASFCVGYELDDIEESEMEKIIEKAEIGDLIKKFGYGGEMLVEV